MAVINVTNRDMPVPHLEDPSKEAPMQPHTKHYDIPLPAGELSAFDSATERRLSDLTGYFSDVTAYNRLCESDNPLLYTVHGTKRSAQPGELISGITRLLPGKVGNEYFMTKGHYHALMETAEVYYCLQGTGMLLLESEEGEITVEPFPAGRVVQIPTRWAHRTVNTGDDELLFFWVCPANAGHNYGSIAERGFRVRVIENAGTPLVIEK